MRPRALAAIALLGLLAGSGCATREASQGRPWVHTLELRQVKQVRASALRAKIALAESSPLWWLPLTSRRYLDPFTLLADRERIEAYYRAHGLFSAKVQSAETRPFRKSGVDVAITVEEGAPTRLRFVEVRGLPSLAPGEGVGHLHLHRGTIFDHEAYLAERDALGARVRALGYPWAEVTGEVRVDLAAHVADVRLSVRPGVRARFGRVDVKGVRDVDPRAIARHAGIPRGTRFDPEALDEARGRVESLRLFSSVKVEVHPRAGDPSLADVTITVEEGPRHELQLGGGFGLEPQRYDGHASATHTTRSLVGGLATLRLRLEAGYVAVPTALLRFWEIDRHGPIATVEGRLQRPDLPLRLSQLSFTAGYDLGIEYAYQYHGPRLQLGFSQALWHDRVRLAASFNWQRLSFFSLDPDLSQVALDDPQRAGRLFGYVDPYLLGWWQEDASLDLRDRPLDPRRGAYFAVSAEEGGPFAGGAFQYEKVMPEVRAYLPLCSRAVLAGRAQLGQIFTQGELGSPITRRFYLGGPASHRGFGFNRLSQQVASYQDGVIRRIPVGGDQMLLIQAELRVDLIPLGGSFIGLVAFLDGGDVAAGSCSGKACTAPDGASLSRAGERVDLTNLHWAAGGGLRFKLEFGTLRLDFGVRLNRTEAGNPDPIAHGYDRLAIHVSFGEAF